MERKKSKFKKIEVLVHADTVFLVLGSAGVFFSSSLLM